MNAAAAAPPAAARSAAHLRIGGFTPFTSIDFPGRLAAVVFVQGCAWRCSWCHNPHLQPRRAQPDAPSWADVLAHLQRRRGLIDGVVFSGGEPTTDPALGAAMAEVRALGFEVGLHTAGIHGRRLREVLPLADWVGFDVKAPLDDAAMLAATIGVRDGSVARHAVADSLRAVIVSGVDFECRTTAHPALLDHDALLRLASGLATLGVRRWALQIARPVPAQGAAALPAVPSDWPGAAALDTLRAMFESFEVRREG